MTIDWKNITTAITLSSLIFGSNIVISNFHHSPAFAQARKQKNVGVIHCSGIQEGMQKRAYNIQSATLENAKNGFTLIMTVKGWQSTGWVSGDHVVYQVTSDLKIPKIDYYSDGLPNESLRIEKNGKFSYDAMITSRSHCGGEGTLNFGKGVKQKLFR
jgi:hypothetical protein